jgi:uncharacterized membrane protein YqiK
MLFAVITLCAVLVGAGIVSAGCFFWLVYRGPSPDEVSVRDGAAWGASADTGSLAASVAREGSAP